MLVRVIDNSGYSSTHGEVEKIISLGEIVEVIYQEGCCFKIKKANGYEVTLNTSRFEMA